MEPGPYEQVPLNEDEKSMLLEIYDSRLRMMFLVYIVLLAMVLSLFGHLMDWNPKYTGPNANWGDNGNRLLLFISRNAILLANMLCLGAVISSTGIYYYFKKIRPLKADADSGVKEKVPYRIIRKEYDLLHEYYVALDDPNCMHYLLDEETYLNCQEGEYVYICRGAKSKFVFERDGRYDLV